MASESKPEVTVSVAGRKWASRWVVFITIGCIILFAAVLLLANLQRQHSEIQARDKLVTQAAPYLKSDSASRLVGIVTQIKQQPGYEHDPNCLYVLTVYYINISDPANTKTYDDMLTRTYDTKKGYSNELLKQVAKSPQDLQPQVNFIESQTKEINQNFFGVPAEPKL